MLVFANHSGSTSWCAGSTSNVCNYAYDANEQLVKNECSSTYCVYGCSGGVCKSAPAPAPVPEPEPACTPGAGCSYGGGCGGVDDCGDSCGSGNVNECGECGNAACCSDTSWGPSTSTYCSGVSFTQTSNCENTRPATGTKVCCTPSNYCSGGDSYEMSSSCTVSLVEDCGVRGCDSGTGLCKKALRVCTAAAWSCEFPDACPDSGVRVAVCTLVDRGCVNAGAVKPTDTELCTPDCMAAGWLPDVDLSGECSDVSFEQTRCGESRVVWGVKDCCVPEWGPDASAYCEGVGFIQTSTNCGGEELHQSAVGTRTCCTPSSYCFDGDAWEMSSGCTVSLVEDCGVRGCDSGTGLCKSGPAACTVDAWSCDFPDLCPDSRIKTTTCTLIDNNCANPDAVKPQETTQSCIPDCGAESQKCCSGNSCSSGLECIENKVGYTVISAVCKVPRTCTPGCVAGGRYQYADCSTERDVGCETSPEPTPAPIVVEPEPTPPSTIPPPTCTNNGGACGKNIDCCSNICQGSPGNRYCLAPDCTSDAWDCEFSSECPATGIRTCEVKLVDYKCPSASVVKPEPSEEVCTPNCGDEGLRCCMDGVACAEGLDCVQNKAAPGVQVLGNKCEAPELLLDPCEGLDPAGCVDYPVVPVPEPEPVSGPVLDCEPFTCVEGVTGLAYDENCDEVVADDCVAVPDAVCVEGETDSADCTTDNCFPGKRTRTCQASGQWGSFSSCTQVSVYSACDTDQYCDGAGGCVGPDEDKDSEVDEPAESQECPSSSNFKCVKGLPGTPNAVPHFEYTCPDGGTCYEFPVASITPLFIGNLGDVSDEDTGFSLITGGVVSRSGLFSDGVFDGYKLLAQDFVDVFDGSAFALVTGRATGISRQLFLAEGLNTEAYELGFKIGVLPDVYELLLQYREKGNVDWNDFGQSFEFGDLQVDEGTTKLKIKPVWFIKKSGNYEFRLIGATASVSSNNFEVTSMPYLQISFRVAISDSSLCNPRYSEPRILGDLSVGETVSDKICYIKNEVFGCSCS
ncbi:hypothetical protein CMO88_01505 [Candidatus Woesearchaeota archaeon]|nr:hypothetical protein [Candidatus Woesearchaeota archaeon]